MGSVVDPTPRSLTPKYIVPEEKRPNLSEVSHLETIPIIDLNQDLAQVVQQVSRACEEYGFFQVINHGISEELCDRTMAIVTEFFDLPPEEKAPLFTTDNTKTVRLFNYYLTVEGQEKVTMWSENLVHPWDPLDHVFHLLPEKPPQYRGVVAEYAKEIGELMNKLLSLMSQGLDKDHIERRIGKNRTILGQANSYPPCPNPELTLGLAIHTDSIAAITVLRQFEGVSGLQVLKDGKWVSVDPIPNTFVINLGDQMEVLSNGRYKSVHHRAVTNKTKRRLSLALFHIPHQETLIGPIAEITDEEHPPLYRNYRFAEFLQEFHRQEGTRRMVKEVFKLEN